MPAFEVHAGNALLYVTTAVNLGVNGNAIIQVLIKGLGIIFGRIAIRLWKLRTTTCQKHGQQQGYEQIANQKMGLRDLMLINQ